MSNDDCEEILVDENRGIALIELPGLTKYDQLYQLELHDFQRVAYEKNHHNDCLYIEFSEGQLDLIFEAWGKYRKSKQCENRSERTEK